ncbi:YvaD family protein [Paenibacillus durus]|uniref:Membrane protein n=1 Tax=Paenibacillus durus ATCC 35681 TaxID=1333534 RepID=A0A0F7CJY9_PAEDU|nr:YvaD family protein [Paenibacillus durus]AKG36741.1 membrane protein [Paenibacillus durus ATCC 35681]
MSGKLKGLFLFTDLSFLVYWLATAFHWIPPEYAYQDYNNKLLVVWNWSFFPLDLLISATGLLSLYYYRKNSPVWRPLVLISLILTSCSGLQAIAFWAIKQDFDLAWWIPNLYLLCYPLFFLPGLVREISFSEVSMNRRA